MDGAFVRGLLEAVERRGIDGVRLIEGLDLGDALSHPRGRLDWNEYALLLDRLCEAVGGEQGVGAVAEDMIRGSRTFALVASSVLDLKRLIQFGFERLAPAVYRNLGSRVEVLAHRRLRLRYAIPESYRGSLVFGYGTVGSLRAYPRLLGLPDLPVISDLDSHKGVLSVELPPSETLPARASRAVRAHLARLFYEREASEGGGEPFFRNDIPEDLAERGIRESAMEIGQRLAGLEDLVTLAESLDRVARERFLVERTSLFVRSPEGELVPVVSGRRARATGPRALRPLLVDGAEVGQVEMDLAPREDWPPELELVLPWVALAVDRCARRSQLEAESAAEHAARAASAWTLTPREAAVLELVVGGLSNKEVAAALGTSVKNVEAALTLVLRKAGASSRTALVAAVWNVSALPSRDAG